MSIKGKLYVLATIAAGCWTLGAGLLHWRSDDPTRFLCYVAFAALAAVLKIRLPSIIGTVSVHFALILVCIATLNLPETLVIGCASVALQCALDSKPQKRLLSVAFHMASSAIAVTLGYATYQTFAASHLVSTPPLVMVVAACVYFFANTVPEVLFTAVTETKTFAKLWEGSCFWTFPHYIAGGAAAGLLTMTDRRGGWEMTLLILPVLYWMYHSYKFYLARLEDERRNGQDLMALQIRTIEALAVAIEGKDPVEQGHHSRIYIYTAEIGREMGLSAQELQALHAAALLRDIGRLAVPEHIFSKPGKLTEAEFEKVKTHPVAGAEILERIDFPYPVAPIVLAHHEKWDGSGYPAGLKGKEIPLPARILAVVDCLDALVSERHYRSAVSLEAAVKHILSESGKSFDPSVVEVMVLRTHKLERMVEDAERRPKISRRVSPLRDASRGESSSSKPHQEVSGIAAARQEARQILELAQELGNSLSVDETLSVLALRIERLCPYDSIAIYIRRDEFLQPEYASGEDCQFFGSLTIPWGEGLSGWVAEHRTPIINGDPSAESHAHQSTRSTLMKSALVVPLEGLNGVVGVLAVYARNELAFTNDHLRILSAVTTKVALSVENALKYRQVERSAVTDVLTGLPNARALFEHLDSELARARRQEKQLAVVVCDLDGFKQVNDRLGHLEGNRVLRSMGVALKNTCREYDYVARMGGDEFVVVLSDYRSESLAAKTEQLSRAAAQCGLETVNSKLGISSGAAIFPADGLDAESLLAVADQRMYQAKRRRGLTAVSVWPAEAVGQSVQ